MAKPRNKYIDLLAYLAVRVFATFVHMFEPEDCYLAARRIGDLLYRFDRRHSRMAMEHLRRSFPQMDEAALARIARESMRGVAYLGLEVLLTTRMITPARWRRHIELVNMAEALRMMIERKTGMIFLTGHFGNWEVVGYTMAALGFACNAVARALDNPYLNDFILGVRQKRGMTILDKKGAMRDMDAILADNGIVCFIADQDAGRKGLFVDFFGRKASTYKSIGLLALQYNIPVVVGFGRRLDYKYHFEIGIQRIIRPEEWASKDDPLTWVTQEYTSALEQVIRRSPEQYLWVHRRWKHRPKGEPQPANGVA